MSWCCRLWIQSQFCWLCFDDLNDVRKDATSESSVDLVKIKIANRFSRPYSQTRHFFQPPQTPNSNKEEKTTNSSIRTHSFVLNPHGTKDHRSNLSSIMVKVLHQKHFDAFVTLVSKTESMHNRWEPAEEFVRLMKKQPGIDYRAGFLNGAIGDVMHFGKLSFQANSPRGGTIYVQHRQKTILAYDRSKQQKTHFYFVSREEQHFEVEEPIQNFQQMRELHESTMYWKMYNPQSKKKRRLESAASSHQGKQQQDTKSPAASTGNVVAPDSSLPTHQSRQQTMQASATWWAPMLIPQSAYVTGLHSTVSYCGFSSVYLRL